MCLLQMYYPSKSTWTNIRSVPGYASCSSSRIKTCITCITRQDGLSSVVRLVMRLVVRLV